MAAAAVAEEMAVAMVPGGGSDGGRGGGSDGGRGGGSDGASDGAVMEAEDVLSKLYFIDTNLMCKNCSWAWVAKIGDRQTGACYFVSEVWVLKATLCATSVAQILITYPTKMGMVVTSSRVHSRRNSRSGISIK